MLRQHTLLLQDRCKGWAVGLVTRQTQLFPALHILQELSGKVVTKERGKLFLHITDEAVEDDSVVMSVETSFDATRTVASAFVVLNSMLTVRALKLPSTPCLGQMREGEGVN